MVVPPLIPPRRVARPFTCNEAKLPWEEKGSVALASEHLYTCNASPRKKLRWRIRAASEPFCDKISSKDGAAKASSFRVVRLKQVGACEESRHQILRPTGCSSEARPARPLVCVVRCACKARGLSAKFPSSKANTRGARQSAGAYAQGNL